MSRDGRLMSRFANCQGGLECLLVIVAISVIDPQQVLKAQDDTATVAAGCRTGVLAEQLRDGCFNNDVLSRVIPGFADLSHFVPPLCAYTVYLTDPASQADNARKVLAPIVYIPSEPGFCSETGIKVRRSRYSWSKLRSIEERAGEIIDKAGYRARTFANIRDARIVVVAHNRRALERTRILLGRDPITRSNISAYEMNDGPEELDRPVVPPRAASLIVLDSLAAHYAGSDSVAFDASTLPGGTSADDVVARRLRLKSPNDGQCSKKMKILFEETRQWVNGRIQYRVFEVDRAMLYEVTCIAARCRTSHSPLPGAGDYIDSC